MATDQKKQEKPAEEITRERELGDKNLQKGNFDTALGHYLRWAGKVGTADAFVEIAKIFDQRKRQDLALHLYQYALVLDPNHAPAAKATSRLQDKTEPPQSNALADIALRIDLDAPDAVLATAASLVQRTTDLKTLLSLTIILRDAGFTSDPTPWLPTTGTGRSFVRWLYGQAEDRELDTADINVQDARTHAVKLAMHERRWTDAWALVGPAPSLESAVIHFQCGDTKGALEMLLPCADLEARVLERAQIPSPRRFRCRDSSLQSREEQADASFKRNEFVMSACLYAMIGKTKDPMAWQAQLNEVLAQLHLGNARYAETILLDLRRAMPRDPAILRAYSVCALQLSQHNDASNALNELLTLDPEPDDAAVIAAALATRRGDHKHALGLLRERLPKLDPLGIQLLLRASEALGDYGILALNFSAVAESFRMTRAELGASDFTDSVTHMGDLKPMQLRTQKELEQICVALIWANKKKIAQQFIDAYIKYHPNFFPALVLKERVRAHTGRPQEAIAALRALATETTNPSPHTYKVMAECHILNNDPDSALNVLDRFVLPARPHDKEAIDLRHRAVIMRHGANWPEPLPSPFGPGAPLPPAETTRTSSESAGAFAPFLVGTRRIDAPSTSTIQTADELRTGVHLMKARGQLKRAEEYVRRYVLEHPQLVSARLVLGELLVELGNSNEAEAELRSALHDAPASDRFEVARALVRLLLNRGAAAEAAEVLLIRPIDGRDAGRDMQELAIEVAKHDSTGLGHLAVARMLRRAGDTSGAVEQLETALIARPSDARVIAECEAWAPHLLLQHEVQPERIRSQLEKLVRRGQQLGALRLILHYLRKNPENQDLIRLHAEALVNVGSESEAIAIYQYLAERGKRKQDRLALGKLLGRADRTHEEIEQYAAILDDNPFDPEVHRRLVAMDRRDLLPVMVADPKLLDELSRLLERNRHADLMRVYERLRTAGPRKDTLRCLDILIVRQPSIEVWSLLRHELNPSAALVPAVIPEAMPLPNPIATDSALQSSDDYLRDGPQRVEVWSKFEQSGAYDAWREAVQVLAPRAFASSATAEKGPNRQNNLFVSTHHLIHLAWMLCNKATGTERVALVLEAAWLYRVLAKFLYNKSEHGRSRNKDRRPTDQRRRGVMNQRRITYHRDIQRLFLPRALNALAAQTAEESLTIAHELLHVSITILPPFMRYLQRYLEHALTLTDKIERLQSTLDLDLRNRIVSEAFTTYDRLTARSEVPIQMDVWNTLRVLAEQWRDVLDERSHELKRAPRLEVFLIVKMDETRSDSFLVEIQLRNAGGTSARDIFVKAESPDFDSRWEIAPKYSDLPATDSTTVVLPFHQVPRECRSIEIKGSVRYATTNGLRREETFEEAIAPPWIPPRTFVESPYKAGLPLDPNDKSFINRTELVKSIHLALGQKNNKNTVLLYGLRRVGKTSLLKKILMHPPEGDLPAFVDMQRLTGEEMKTGDVLRKIAQSIAEALANSGTPIEVAPDSDWRERPTDCLDKFLTLANTAAAGRRLLVMLDEFGALIQKIESKHVDKSILDVLRSIIQHQPFLVFVLVGDNRVRELVHRYDSVLFNQARMFQVSFLSPAEARSLIVTPAEGIVTYKPAAVDLLVEMTAGHPYFLQDLCHQLVTTVPRNEITVTDVMHAAEERIQASSASDSYAHHLDQVEPMDKLLLATIAELTERTRRNCVASEVAARLAKLEHPLDEHAIFERSSRLHEIDLVRYEKQPDGSIYYRISIPLVAKWMRRFHNIDVLVSDVAVTKSEHDEDTRYDDDQYDDDQFDDHDEDIEP